jgi:hypothetical protein
MKVAYNPKRIEQKWQAYWEEQGTFSATHEQNDGRPKFYVLDMFPYPSGRGLHVGHPRGYVASDVVARFNGLGFIRLAHGTPGGKGASPPRGGYGAKHLDFSDSAEELRA